MYPTLNATGDIIFLDKLTMRFRPLGVGDIVIAESPKTPGQTVCKRIIAIEGEQIELNPRASPHRHRLIKVSQVIPILSCCMCYSLK